MVNKKRYTLTVVICPPTLDVQHIPPVDFTLHRTLHQRDKRQQRPHGSSLDPECHSGFSTWLLSQSSP